MAKTPTHLVKIGVPANGDWHWIRYETIFAISDQEAFVQAMEICEQNLREQVSAIYQLTLIEEF